MGDHRPLEADGFTGRDRGQFFDDFTRQFAGHISRRQSLKALFWLSAGMVGGRLFNSASAAAATPQSSAAATDQCAQLQSTLGGSINYFPLSGDCQTANNSANLPGCGAGAVGCTTVSFSWGSPKLLTPLQPYKNKATGKWCAKATIQVQWSSNISVSAHNWAPTEPICCNTNCQQELDQWRQDVCGHELEHVTDAQGLARAGNSDWASKVVDTCACNPPPTHASCISNVNACAGAKNQKDAQNLFPQVLNQELCDYGRNLADVFGIRDTLGNQFPLPCQDCVPALGHICCNNTCYSVSSSGALLTQGDMASAAVQVCGDQCCGECQTCDQGTCRPCDPNRCEHCEADGTCVTQGNVCGDHCCGSAACCGSPDFICCPQGTICCTIPGTANHTCASASAGCPPGPA
jgi:hypothetical protein